MLHLPKTKKGHHMHTKLQTLHCVLSFRCTVRESL